MAHEHAFVLDPEHRQGDLVLTDGARLVSCTKNVRAGTRTSMLFLRGLMRIDVLASSDEFEIALRPLTSAYTFRGGPPDATHRRTQSFEGEDHIVSDFVVDIADSPVAPVRVSISRPAERGERFPVTAVAVVGRRS